MVCKSTVSYNIPGIHFGCFSWFKNHWTCQNDGLNVKRVKLRQIDDIFNFWSTAFLIVFVCQMSIIIDLSSRILVKNICRISLISPLTSNLIFCELRMIVPLGCIVFTKMWIFSISKFGDFSLFVQACITFYHVFVQQQLFVVWLWEFLSFIYAKVQREILKNKKVINLSLGYINTETPCTMNKCEISASNSF